MTSNTGHNLRSRDPLLIYRFSAGYEIPISVIRPREGDRGQIKCQLMRRLRIESGHDRPHEQFGVRIVTPMQSQIQKLIEEVLVSLSCQAWCRL